ncbi:helix-turn-helix transcriptional regulator [Catenulispora yoronensis]|uniref:Helix-turn-helix transcriptional regulator n=1 Tax=Catenulispora yoronensis TaxID=450799 RepID=A0ABP5G1B0_9ACTN
MPANSERSQPVSGINVLRWELGNELRTLRIRAGRSIADAANELECSPAKISRMENGQRGAVARDVRDLCVFYDAPEEQREQLMKLSKEAAAADQNSSSTIAAKYATYVALESKARSLWNYESTFIPGMLQTERYARLVVSLNGDLVGEDVERHVAVRMSRQRRIWDADAEDTLTAVIVVDENVLWRPAGMDKRNRAIREEQVDRLIQASRLPNVTLRIIPYEANFYQGMEGATINLLDVDEGADKASSTCYLEGIFIDLFVRGHSEIAMVVAKFAKLTEKALSPSDTRKFLMRIAKGNYEHWTTARPSGSAEDGEG